MFFLDLFFLRFVCKIKLNMKSIFKRIIINLITFEAKLVLAKYKPKIVAITGSVGKTGTKEALYSVLNKNFFVRQTKTNSNNEFSAPLTILDCPNGGNNPFSWIKNILRGVSLIVFKHQYPQWLILEISAERPGDIEKISKWLKTDIVIITRLGDMPAHVEFFDSVEHLVKEKAFLIDSLKEDGLLVLNGDDERISKLKGRDSHKVVSYGFGKQAQVKAGKTRISYKKGRPAGLFFELSEGADRSSVKLKNVLGKHHIYVALATYSAVSGVDIQKSVVLDALSDYIPPAGRLRLVEGIKNSVIIDDSYNSSPIAVLAGLETLKRIKTKGKKIAVLGDMLELGKYTVDAHKTIGLAAGKISDLLLVVGPRSQYIIEGALDGGLSEKNIIEFNDSREAGKYLERKLKEDDIVFVKGSQIMRMERAVEEIMLHPENKSRVLARQGVEWSGVA